MLYTIKKGGSMIPLHEIYEDETGEKAIYPLKYIEWLENKLSEAYKIIILNKN